MNTHNLYFVDKFRIHLLSKAMFFIYLDSICMCSGFHSD